MVCKINKKYLKIASSFLLIFINILFVSILFLYGESAFSKVTNIEKDLALKYCDSLDRNLFKGLDNERILKYEYFFNSIKKEVINDEKFQLNKFVSEVKTICSYQLKNEEEEEMRQLLKSFLIK